MPFSPKDADELVGTTFSPEAADELVANMDSYEEPPVAPTPKGVGPYAPVSVQDGQATTTDPLSMIGDWAKAGAGKVMDVLGAPKALGTDSPAYAAMLMGPSEWKGGSGPAAKAKLAAPPQRENAAGQLLGKAARAIPPVEPISILAHAKDRAMDELAALGQKAQQEGRSTDAFQYQKLQELLDNVETQGSALLTDPMMMSGAFLKLLGTAPAARAFLGGAIPKLGSLLGGATKGAVGVGAADAAGRVTGPLMDEGSRAAALPELPDAALQGYFATQAGKGLGQQRKADIANSLPGTREGLKFPHPATLDERIKSFTEPARTPDRQAAINRVVDAVGKLRFWGGHAAGNVGTVAPARGGLAVTPQTALKVIDGLSLEMGANRDPSLPHTEKARPLGPQFTEAELLKRLGDRGVTPEDVRTVFDLLQKQGFLKKESARRGGGEPSYSISSPEHFQQLRSELNKVVPAPESIVDAAHAENAKAKQRSSPPVPVLPLDEVLAPPPKTGKGSRTAAKRARLSQNEPAPRGTAIRRAEEIPPNSPLMAKMGQDQPLVFDPEQAPGTPRLDTPPDPFIPTPDGPPQGPTLPPPPIPAGELPVQPATPGTKRLPVTPPPALPVEPPPPPGAPDPLVPPKPYVPRKVELKPPPLHLSTEQKSYFLEKGIPLRKAQKLLDLGRDGAWEAMASDKTLKGLTPQARTAILRKLFAPSLAPPPGVGPHQVLKPPPPKPEE